MIWVTIYFILWMNFNNSQTKKKRLEYLITHWGTIACWVTIEFISACDFTNLFYTITKKSRLTPKNLTKNHAIFRIYGKTQPQNSTSDRHLTSTTLKGQSENLKQMSWNNPVFPIDAKNSISFLVQFFGGVSLDF